MKPLITKPTAMNAEERLELIMPIILDKAFSRKEKKEAIKSFAESLARERAVGFAFDNDPNGHYSKTKLKEFIGKQYDQWLSDKTKEDEK